MINFRLTALQTQGLPEVEMLLVGILVFNLQLNKLSKYSMVEEILSIQLNNHQHLDWLLPAP